MNKGGDGARELGAGEGRQSVNFRKGGTIKGTAGAERRAEKGNVYLKIKKM